MKNLIKNYFSLFILLLLATASLPAYSADTFSHPTIKFGEFNKTKTSYYYDNTESKFVDLKAAIEKFKEQMEDRNHSYKYATDTSTVLDDDWTSTYEHTDTFIEEAPKNNLEVETAPGADAGATAEETTTEETAPAETVPTEVATTETAAEETSTDDGSTETGATAEASATTEESTVTDDGVRAETTRTDTDSTGDTVVATTDSETDVPTLTEIVDEPVVEVLLSSLNTSTTKQGNVWNATHDESDYIDSNIAKISVTWLNIDAESSGSNFTLPNTRDYLATIRVDTHIDPDHLKNYMWALGLSIESGSSDSYLEFKNINTGEIATLPCEPGTLVLNSALFIPDYIDASTKTSFAIRKMGTGSDSCVGSITQLDLYSVE